MISIKNYWKDNNETQVRDKVQNSPSFPTSLRVLAWTNSHFYQIFWLNGVWKNEKLILKKMFSELYSNMNFF